MHAVPFDSPTESFIRRLIKGALSGFLATAPMSLSMVTGWRLLPKRERYHLPPRLIIDEITEKAGLEKHLKEEQLIGLAILSHFGYGALFGSLYALFERRVPLPTPLKGGLMGVAIWAGSYLGWLPATGILKPATQHPWRRNLLMILAHVIWGMTLGGLLRKLTANELHEWK